MRCKSGIYKKKMKLETTKLCPYNRTALEPRWAFLEKLHSSLKHNEKTH